MTLTHQDITVLLEQCKLGKQQAQMEVYNRYYHAMYNAALRIVKDKFEAEDIMQNSFLSAFTKLHSLKDAELFGAWLKRIVINNAIYHYKTNAKYREVPLDDIIYKIEDNDDGFPEDEAFKTIKATEVLDAMKTLKDNYQTSLTLHLIEGYDYEEICEIMNISHANCRTMISRAKASLRQKMQPLLS